MKRAEVPRVQKIVYNVQQAMTISQANRQCPGTVQKPCARIPQQLARLSERLGDCSVLFQQDTVSWPLEPWSGLRWRSWERRRAAAGRDQISSTRLGPSGAEASGFFCCEVRYGSRPSLLLGDAVYLKLEPFGELIPPGRRGDFVLGATAVAAGVGAVAVDAALDAPSEATTCGAIRFSAERSTGGAGRALG